MRLKSLRKSFDLVNEKGSYLAWDGVERKPHGERLVLQRRSENRLRPFCSPQNQSASSVVRANE